MKIKVLFFGATAVITGQRRVEADVALGSKASAIFEKLATEHPSLAKHGLHFAVNQEYAIGDETLNDGDELAIFTAVSGG